MVFEKIKEIIVKQLEINPEKVTMDAYFVDDLDADSLDVMEMVMAFEEEFGIEVEEDSLEKIKQVKDLVDYFETRI